MTIDCLVLPALFMAGAWDLRYRRCPNLLTYGLMGTALLLHWAKGDLLSSLSGLCVGLGWLLLPYLAGGMGAGDVKLMGAIGAWFGWPLALWAIAWSSIAGGVLVLVLSLHPSDWRACWLAMASGGAAPLKTAVKTAWGRKSSKVPYAAAMAIGSLIVCLPWG